MSVLVFFMSSPSLKALAERATCASDALNPELPTDHRQRSPVYAVKFSATITTHHPGRAIALPGCIQFNSKLRCYYSPSSSNDEAGAALGIVGDQRRAIAPSLA